MPPPTTATQPRAPKPLALPTLAELATVERDLARCNRTIDVWLARSDTHGHIRYDVIYEKHRDTWACNCPASRSCKHITRCKVLAEARTFERLFADCAPAELRALIPGKACQVRCDVDALSAWAALLVIDALLLAADEPLEAAVAA